MTGGEYLLRFLLSQGVDTGFGIPGALNAHLYDALPGVPEFRHVLVRHELGGAWMADGFARARNEVGVAFTVPGPGATHAASAVAGAYTDCSRLLLISSQSETSWRGEFRRDLFHGLDQQRLFAGITKWSAAATRVSELPELLHQAFHHLRRGRPGPVQLEIPADVFGQSLDAPVPRVHQEASLAAPAPGQVIAAASLLQTAQRPVILAGDGVLHTDAGKALGDLATRLGAPVITTVMGKGALPETHPWSAGDSNASFGSAVYQDHDVLLAAGVRFTQVDTRWPWFFPPRQLIHIDADAREIGRVFDPLVGMVADVRPALEALLPALGTGYPAKTPSTRNLIPADPFSRLLVECFPPESQVAFDVCVPGFRSRMDWVARHPHRYFYPGVYVGMGFGLPVGAGAQLAHPGRPTWVVAGDGGFQMTLGELGTVAQQQLPLRILVVNDGGLTLIRRVQDREFDGRRSEVELRNPDFAALAASYGLANRRVESLEALRDAIRWANGVPGPVFVEYRVEGS